MKTVRITTRIDKDLHDIIVERDLCINEVINDSLRAVLIEPGEGDNILTFLTRLIENLVASDRFRGNGEYKVRTILESQLDKVPWMKTALIEKGVTPGIIVAFITSCKTSGVLVGRKSAREFLLKWKAEHDSNRD